MECLIQADQPNISEAGTFATLETLAIVLSHQCHIRKVHPLNTISMCHFWGYIFLFCKRYIQDRQSFGALHYFDKVDGRLQHFEIFSFRLIP